VGVVGRARLGSIAWRLVIAVALVLFLFAAGRPGARSASAAPDAGWSSFQHDAQATGVDSGQPLGSTWARGWTTELDGTVAGQPLVVGGMVVAATEHNSVYAIDPATGTPLWHTYLGFSVSVGALPCGLGGTSTPEVGIESTPVVDPATGVIYVVAMLNNPNSTPGHELFALRLSDGSTVWHQNVDVTGTDPMFYNQEAGLVLASGKVYIAYGTYAGCEPFHGRVIAVNNDGSGSPTVFTIGANGVGGGIGGNSGLQAGAVSVDPTDGSLLVATGPAAGATPDSADSVLRLSPALAQLDSFTPTNWMALNNSDLEMSSAPVLVGGDRVFEMNQNGVGYLLNAGALGGIGGQVYSAQVCGGGNGSVAVHGSSIYVPCADGMVALSVAADGMSFSTTWSRAGSYFETAVYSGGTIWSVGNGGLLIQFDAATGLENPIAPVSSAKPNGGPASGGGRLFVASRVDLMEFNALGFPTTSLPDATAGQPYTTTLAAVGGVAPVRWFPGAGSSLPPGLALATSGVLGGTPRVAGSYSIKVNATDATAPFNLVVTGMVTLTVNPGLAITTASMPVAQVGSAYSQTLTAAGGVSPLSFRLGTGSSLPAGLGIDSSGHVTGTPTTAGFTRVTFVVTDSAASPVTSTSDLIIDVVPPPTSSPAWSSFQHDAQATGADVVAPAVAVTKGWSSFLDGTVTAQPLVVDGIVVAATEHDSVYALNPANGAIVWQNHLGDSVPASATCMVGLAPEIGIESTPVVDTATGTLYVVAMFRNSPRHELFALKLSDGSILWHQTVDVAGTDPLFYNQEAGLVLTQGKVYIPFGTFAGCLPFQGRLVAVNEDGTGSPTVFTVGANGGGGGIGGNSGWAGAVSVDPTDGSLLVATGPGTGGGIADSADSVLRLSPGLTQLESFTPLNWISQTNADIEMSSAPVVVGGNRVFAMNQGGTGYLLDAGTLGELYSAQVCAGSGSGSVAVNGSFIYAPCSDGLVALKVASDGMSFSTAWAAAGTNAGTPILSGGLVWTHRGSFVDAYDAASGSLVFNDFEESSIANGGLASGGGRIFVASRSLIVDFNLTIPAPTITAPATGFDTTSTVVTVGGTGFPGATITLTDTGTGALAVGSTTVDGSGNWSTTGVLGYGTHSLTATETGNGSTSDPSNTVTGIVRPAAPMISSPATGSSTASPLTISGAAAPGAMVNLFDGSSGLASTVGDTVGHFSIVVTLAIGPHSLTASQTVNGETSTPSGPVTIDVVPAAPAISSPSTGTSTTNGAVTVSGNADPGATVNLFDGSSALASTAGDATGHFSIVVTLAIGPHSLTATQTVNGETSAASSAVSIDVKPAVPTITSPADGFDINLTAVAVGGKGVPGSTINLTDSGPGTLTLPSSPVIVAGDGTWSVAATLGAGKHQLSATQTNNGETSAPSNSVAGRIDLTSPVLTLPANQKVNAPSPTGVVVSYTVTAIDPDDSAPTIVISCTPASGSTFPLGITIVSCSAIDPAGNKSSGSFTVTVVMPTTVGLGSSINPVAVGQSVTYTATISPTPTGGSVTFIDDGSTVCVSVLSGATAACTQTYPVTVSHNIQAVYSGIGGFILGSTSPVLTEVVTKNHCATLLGCNLSGADLSNANLAGADLSGANLNQANLTGASLNGANLTNANFNNANLTGAKLRGAITTGANFNKVTWSNTICPDGTNSDINGGTCSGHL
jgi:outer membrane protein assembly factor BamB